MKRPWNIIDTPVYSLATYADGVSNMNICTYVTAISMAPKLYAVAVYNGSKTLAQMQETSVAVLQLLHSDQYSLVNQLGKKSGNSFDKHHYLQQKNLLQEWNSYEVLKNVSALLLLQKVNQQQTGDHVLFTFEVSKYVSYNDQVLTASILRAKKIISA